MVFDLIFYCVTVHTLYLFLYSKRATVVFSVLWFLAPHARSSFSEVKVAILLPICCYCVEENLLVCLELLSLL